MPKQKKEENHLPFSLRYQLSVSLGQLIILHDGLILVEEQPEVDKWIPEKKMELLMLVEALENEISIAHQMLKKVRRKK